MKWKATAFQQQPQPVSIRMVRQGVLSAGAGNSRAFLRVHEVEIGQFRRVSWRTVPGTVHTIGGKALDIRDMLSQVEPATS
jgi:hypothetical protein